jgi:hypothetical protein
MRNFWDFAFVNPELIKPNHCAVYCYAVDQCNRLGWKAKFGFPAQTAMDAVGIVSFKTYSKTLNELVEMGFIDMVIKTTNQHTANIIALVNFTEAIDKALDRAIIQHVQSNAEASREQGLSNSTIDRPIYHLTNIPINQSKTKNEKFFSELKNSPTWIESIQSQNKIKESEVLEWLDVFKIKLEAEIDNKNSKNELASHFARWLPIEFKKQKEAGVNIFQKKELIGCI